MARKTKIKSATQTQPHASLLKLMLERVAPILNQRPPDSLTLKEMADAAGVSADVIRRKLAALRSENQINIREARVRSKRGGYTIVYWVE